MEEITKYLALWGALVSTIALLWNIKNSLSDKGALTLFGERAYFMRSFLEESKEKLHKAILRNLKSGQDKADRFRLFAYNVGKRPIIVSDIKIQYKGLKSIPSLRQEKIPEERSMIMKSDFPLKIDAGDYAEFDYSWEVINDDFDGVTLCSADGKKYHMSKTNIASIKENNKEPMRVKVIGRKSSNKSMQPTANASAD